MRKWIAPLIVVALSGCGSCGGGESPAGDAGDAGAPDAAAVPDAARDGGGVTDAEIVSPDLSVVADDAEAGDLTQGGAPCESTTCGTNERCVEKGGEASCECIPGFVEAAGTCVVRPVECVVNQNCGASGLCVEGACTCRPGFVGDGFECSASVDCREDEEACDPNASCVDTDSGTACVCPDGMRGNGRTCRDVAFSKIWTSQNMTCGLRTDGVVSCWGFEAFGTSLTAQWAPYPADEPTGLSWADLDHAEIDGCAIRDDQTMWCTKGWDRQVGPERTWSEVVGFTGTNCAIATDGGLYCWGDNTDDRLALGSDVRRVDEPTRIGEDAWNHVVVTSDHGCGIKADGTLWCWGSSTLGQAGPTPSDVPVRVGSESDWETLAAYRSATCGLRAGGELWCWGFPEATDGVPIRIGTETWSDVSVNRHTCAVRTDGTLWCRGTSGRGAHGSDETELAAFEQVGTGSDWQSVAVGPLHTCALERDGSAWCFGSNSDGQLGIGTFRFQRYPLRVDSTEPWSAVSSGEEFTCGIRQNGRLACAGSGRPVAQGWPDSPYFVDLNAETWLDVAANWDSVCAIRDDRTLHCSPGTLAAGTVTLAQVGTDADWQRIFLRDESFCGIRAGGDLYCWGDHNPDFHEGTQRFSEPTLVTRGVGPWEMVSLYRFHAVGLRSDGTLWDFDLDAPIGTDTDWRFVSVGYSRVCGIKSDDSLWCWPDNAPDPARIGTETWSDVEFHIRTGCATKADGTLWCWGQDTGAGETGTNVYGGSYSEPELVSDVVGWSEVDRGVQTSFGLRSDGGLWAWGMNTSGQLGTGTSWTKTPVRVIDVTR